LSATRGNYINRSKTLRTQTEACPGNSKKKVAPRRGEVAQGNATGGLPSSFKLSISFPPHLCHLFPACLFLPRTKRPAPRFPISNVPMAIKRSAPPSLRRPRRGVRRPTLWWLPAGAFPQRGVATDGAARLPRPPALPMARDLVSWALSPFLAAALGVLPPAATAASSFALRPPSPCRA